MAVGERLDKPTAKKRKVESRLPSTLYRASAKSIIATVMLDVASNNYSTVTLERNSANSVNCTEVSGYFAA